MLIGIDDVIEILDVGTSQGYKIIKELNRELEGMGYRVIRGRTNRRYLLDRYGLAEGFNSDRQEFAGDFSDEGQGNKN